MRQCADGSWLLWLSHNRRGNRKIFGAHFKKKPAGGKLNSYNKSYGSKIHTPVESSEALIRSQLSEESR